MSILLNILILLIVGAIAYWWANQGLFSALLHLICVISAGAVAIALYEWVTVSFMLRGAWFDDYAWGVVLISIFVLALFGFRMASDKLVRANVNMPTWANFTFGMPVGAFAGVLTFGIFFIGAGMLQSHKKIMDYEGYGRSMRTGAVEYLGPAVWIPVHRWTNEFYNYLSIGSFHPTFSDTPLARQNPDLYKQATLLRDTFEQGKGKLSLVPEAANVQAAYYDPETNRHVVAIEFGSLARDFGEQLTLSRSQVRMIAGCQQQVNSLAIHPDAWQQQVPGGGIDVRRFRFDSPSYYVTSMPGAERTVVLFEFPVPSGYRGRYIQIRGTRYELSKLEEAPPGVVPIDPDDLFGEQVVLGAGPNITEYVRVENSMNPINASKNQPLGSLRLIGDYFAEGEHLFRSRGDRPSPSLRIEGIYEPAMTRIVQLYIRADYPHNFFQRDIIRRAPAHARLALVDDAGNSYSPIGFIHESRDGYRLRLDPARFLPTANLFPTIPEGGADTLRIIFRVTQGVTIKGFVFGDATLGRCEVEVNPPGRY